MLNNNLAVGQIVHNNDLKEIFKVGNMGGMRRSLKTNCLVLVSDHTKGVYDDRWEDGTCYLTGMGLTGPQALNAQNKTLYESETNGIQLHFFEVHIAGQYRYHGKVKLAGKPFQEDQLDSKDNLRKVWIFPIKPVDLIEPLPIPLSDLKSLENKREKLAAKLTDSALKKRLENAPKKASKVQTAIKSYYRNPYVAEYVKRRAGGRCELCANYGPFIVAKGFPFLEVHHVKWLSDGGEDTIENTVALCPNCHRKMHFINSNVDVLKLLKIILSYKGL